MTPDNEKSAWDEFMFCLIMVWDERGREKTNPDVIDNWYNQAETLFDRAVAERVDKYLESIALEIQVKK